MVLLLKKLIVLKITLVLSFSKPDEDEAKVVDNDDVKSSHQSLEFDRYPV